MSDRAWVLGGNTGWQSVASAAEDPDTGGVVLLWANYSTALRLGFPA